MKITVTSFCLSSVFISLFLSSQVWKNFCAIHQECAQLRAKIFMRYHLEASICRKAQKLLYQRKDKKYYALYDQNVFFSSDERDNGFLDSYCLCVQDLPDDPV